VTNATQIIILGVFIFFLVVAVIVFAAFGNNSNGSATATIEIWGTIPETILPRISEALNTTKPGSIKIHYSEIKPEQFEATLTTALADGTGPDVVLMPESLLYQNRKRLAIISYKSYPQRNFKDTFIGSSEVLLTDTGTYGLPFLADPLVMYWNRDILSTAGIAQPPSTWEQVVAMVPQISVVNDDKTIKKSAIGLGDYVNVNNGKEILSAFMIQAGSRMVYWRSASEAVNQIAVGSDSASNPTEDALNFFTQFSNPEKPLYSWTRALPNSLDYFSSGDLALYIGLASDGARIRAKNPNLNFDVSLLPQPGNAKDKKTFASTLSFSVLTTSRNQQAALNAIAMLTGPDSEQMAVDATRLAPTRRDLLATIPNSADQSVFYKSALISEGSLDPSPIQTSSVYSMAVESIVAGQATVADSAKTLSKQIDEMLNNQ
jgi:ABC-type glycerol-3-phosphate transport system substrate-binding protein